MTAANTIDFAAVTSPVPAGIQSQGGWCCSTHGSLSWPESSGLKRPNGQSLIRAHRLI